MNGEGVSAVHARIEVNQEDKVVNAAVETQGLAPSMSLRKIRWSVQLRTR